MNHLIENTMKNLINKIVFGAVILGGLTSCVANPEAYSNNNQNRYYNASYNNGNYYAPSSYYGNGGYYANDGYYYRDNMSYQYENNVPYYYGNNQRRIYLEKRSGSQREQNSVRNDRRNSDGVIIRNNPRENQSTNDGFRDTPVPSYRPRIQINPQTRIDNSGGFRNSPAPSVIPPLLK